MGAVQNALTEIRADLLAIPAIASLPAYPPDQMDLGNGPLVLTYLGPASWRLGSSSGGNGYPTRWGVCTVRIEVYIARDDLAVAVQKLSAFADTINGALFAGFCRDRFNGTVVTLGDPEAPGGTPIRSTFGPEDWGDDLVRYRHEIDVAIEEDIVL